MKRTQTVTGYQKYIQKDELALLEEWFKNKGDNHYFVFRAMKELGLRISDAISLNSSYIQDNLLVFAMKKTKKVIEVYVPKKFREWLVEYYIPTHKDKFQDGYMAYVVSGYARSKGNVHITCGTIRTEFHKFRKFYSIKDIYCTDKRGRSFHRISPHCLRHNFAEVADMVTNHNYKVVQDLLGHKDIKTTLIYLRGVRSREHRASVGELVSGVMCS